MMWLSIDRSPKSTGFSSCGFSRFLRNAVCGLTRVAQSKPGFPGVKDKPRLEKTSSGGLNMSFVEGLFRCLLESHRGAECHHPRLLHIENYGGDE